MKKLATIILIIIVFPTVSLAEGGVVSDIKKHLSYLNSRQSLISKNISNADTPDYKTLDLAPIQNEQKHRGIKLQATSPMHITKQNNRYNFRAIKSGDSTDTALNGNDVVIEDEMIKMADTDLEYKKAINMMRQMDSLMKVAIGDNR